MEVVTYLTIYIFLGKKSASLTLLIREGSNCGDEDQLLTSLP